MIRQDRVGDVVLSTPVLQALRRRWPDGYLAILVRPEARDVVLGNPWTDEVLTDDPTGRDRGISGFLRQVARLRSRRFDTALMLLPMARIAYMLFLAGIPRRIGVGRKIYQALTGTGSVSRNRYVPLRHEADYCLDLARAVGAPSDQDRPAVILREEERQEARACLRARGATGRPWVGIHPGNGRSSPNWPPERYGTLAERVRDRFGATLVVTGTASERALVDRMRANAPVPLVSLVGHLSLRQLAAVLGELDVLVSSSTGPMHVAAALGVPTVSLFCPLSARSPQRWGPLSGKGRVLLPPDGECPTCFHGPMCELSSISVDVALVAIHEALGSRGGRCA